jgi:hypothetical protein
VIVTTVPDRDEAGGVDLDSTVIQPEDGEADPSDATPQRASSEGWSKVAPRRAPKEGGDTDTDDELNFKFEEEMPAHRASRSTRKKQSSASHDTSDSEMDDADLDRVMIIVESPDRSGRKIRPGSLTKDRTGCVTSPPLYDLRFVLPLSLDGVRAYCWHLHPPGFIGRGRRTKPMSRIK